MRRSQRLRQRGVVDDAAARHVDERGGGLHERQFGGADRVVALGECRAAPAPDGRPRAAACPCHPARAQRASSPPAGGCGCGRSPSCRSRARRAARCPADAAHAQDAQRGAVHVGAGEHVVAPAVHWPRAQEMPFSAMRRAPPSSAQSRSRRWSRSARRACWSPSRRARCTPARRSCCSPRPCCTPRSCGRASSSAASMRSLAVTKAPALPRRRCASSAPQMVSSPGWTRRRSARAAARPRLRTRRATRTAGPGHFGGLPRRKRAGAALPAAGLKPTCASITKKPPT